MCIMPKVKKCEKTFALNVDIFITPLSIKNFFSNNYTYGIMGGVGKNTTTNIYIGVRINE